MEKNIGNFLKKNSNWKPTKEIIEFIKNNKFPQHKHHKFSKPTKIFITDFLHKIKRIDTQYVAPIPVQFPEYQKSDLFSSIPEQIREYIEKTQYGTKKQSYKFSIADRTIQINIMTFSAYHDDSYIQTALKLIYIWFSFVSKYSTKECGKTLHLYLYLLNLNKHIPRQEGEPFDTIHANTAYTRSCSPTATIQIFREEEWFKVLIHESFHTFGLDFSEMDISPCQKRLREMFSINTKGLLFETYCETWACLINVIFIGYFSSVGITKIQEMMSLETKFAMFQMSKILYHYDLTYQDLDGDDGFSKERYRENTNIFCYYVLECLVLYNLDDFINWCIKNNRENILNFTKTPQNLENFCDFIEKIYKNADFLKDYGKIEEFYDENVDEDQFMYTTMRMTVFG